MINEIDILLQVKNKIKSIYENYPVFLEDTKTNFGDKAFFIKAFTYTRPSTSEIVEKSTNIVITFFSIKGKTQAVDLYRIKDSIINLFWPNIKVKDRTLNTYNLQDTTEGKEADIINITFTIDYLDAKEPAEEYITMTKINTDIRKKD